ncbi:alpha/beta fold hydrolase [Plantactinospora solaniradicis]|uniref:Alpha/beta fold hydrolase n=1 Tax=Plantactinospora solaniradicis TaxID=1723736 RepID=A0ABW1KAH1_9ACTN
MNDGVATRNGVRVTEGGAGQPVLLLLHGMGATGDVWRGWCDLLGKRWPGRWLAPDLPGHGGSAPLDRYTFESFAAAIAGLLDPGDRVVVLGQSLGGAVGLALAGMVGARSPAGVGGARASAGVGGAGPSAGARAGWSVEAVVGIGVKVAWTPDELARTGVLAERPVAWYDSRAEAAQRYLRISGLTGLLDADDSEVDAGLVAAADGRWRLAMDPRAFAVGAPVIADLLLGAVPAPVLLARGERDPLVSDDDLARLGVPATTLPGLGHNAHVEDPAAVAGLLEPYGLTPRD